jgi:hypothetical protein
VVDSAEVLRGCRGLAAETKGLHNALSKTNLCESDAMGGRVTGDINTKKTFCRALLINLDAITMQGSDEGVNGIHTLGIQKEVVHVDINDNVFANE